MSAEEIRLVTARTDAQEAEELRLALKEPLEFCCKILTEARAKGLQVSFSINPDQFGRFTPTIGIVKPL